MTPDPTRTTIQTVTLYSIICGECGVVYAVPMALASSRIEQGAPLWCPNGHDCMFRGTDPPVGPFFSQPAAP